MDNSGSAPERPSGTQTAAGTSARVVMRAPRGESLSCKSWQQEAALRMLMNSLDPEVADRPQKLIPSGDFGRVAADWDAFGAIAGMLRSVENDETFLVHAGKPVRTVRGRKNAPRALIVDSDPAASWTYAGTQSFLPVVFEILAAAARKFFQGTLAGKLVVTESLEGMDAAAALATAVNGGAFLGIELDAERIKRRVKAGFCDVMVNNLDEALRILKNAVRKREPASVGLAANPFDAIAELANRGVVPDLLMHVTEAADVEDFVPCGMSVTDAATLQDTNVTEFVRRVIESIGEAGKARLTLQKLGSIILTRFPDNWEDGKNSVTRPRPGPLVAPIPDLLAPILAEGAAPIRWVALSGEPSDIRGIDRLLLEVFPDDENLRRWITTVQNRVRHQGLPARACILRPAERATFGLAVNDLVARGETKAPILIVRDHADLVCATWATQSDDSIRNPLAVPPDAAEVDRLLDLADGSTWASFQRRKGNAPRVVAQAVVADGTAEMSARIERVFSS